MERAINLEFKLNQKKICFVCEKKVADEQPSIFCQNVCNYTDGKMGYYHTSCFCKAGKQKCKGCKDVKL